VEIAVVAVVAVVVAVEQEMMEAQDPADKHQYIPI
jgi:hypothetical protein